MGLYNFKPQFAAHILSGRKMHTIRAERRHRDHKGSTMHLYTGLRQSGAKLLARVECVRVEPIFFEAANLDDAANPPMVVYLGVDSIENRHQSTGTELDSLAFFDGFDSFAEMESFWVGKLPFRGHVYHWKSLALAGAQKAGQ